VPWRLIGQRLHAVTAGDVVRIFASNDVVATHVTGPPLFSAVGIVMFWLADRPDRRGCVAVQRV